MLSTSKFTFFVLFKADSLTDKSKVIVDRSSRELQLPSHLSKLTINQTQRSSSGFKSVIVGLVNQGRLSNVVGVSICKIDLSKLHKVAKTDLAKNNFVLIILNEISSNSFEYKVYPLHQLNHNQLKNYIQYRSMKFHYLKSFDILSKKNR